MQLYELYSSQSKLTLVLLPKPSIFNWVRFPYWGIHTALVNCSGDIANFERCWCLLSYNPKLSFLPARLPASLSFHFFSIADSYLFPLSFTGFHSPQFIRRNPVIICCAILGIGLVCCIALLSRSLRNGKSFWKKKWHSYERTLASCYFVFLIEKVSMF